MKSGRVKSLSLLAGIICFCSLASFSQSPEADGFFRENRDRLDNQRPARPKSGIKKLPSEPTNEGKILLKPAEADFAAYRQFLNQPNTGIAKIYPDAECNYLIVDVKNDKCLRAIQMAGIGSYYSFRYEENRIYKSDIHFADGSFSITGDRNSLGFIVDFGDLPIESIDKNSAELTNIQKYPLPQTYSELSFQKAKFDKGTIFDSRLWASKTQIKLNTTYGLRIADWDDPAEHAYHSGNIDLLLLLRTIRENEDGGVTIIWRELQRKKASKLRQNK